MMPKILYTLIIFPVEQIIEICYVLAFHISQNPGLSIVGLSIAVSTLILPLYFMAEKQQQAEYEKQNQMRRMKDNINAVFKGDKRYMMLSTLYRQHHYHPAYALRSSLGLLIQVPFFIAAWHFLNNLELINGQAFLFIKDLSTPDRLLFGKINFLPFLMTFINIVSGVVYTKHLENRDKIQAYCIPAVFLILLYNSPAALVLYWTCNNFFNLFKIILLKKIKNLKKSINVLSFLIGGALAVYLLFFHDDLLNKRLFITLLILIILLIPDFKRIFCFLKEIIRKVMVYFNKIILKKSVVFYIISVLPPSIFMFFFYSRNAEYIDYWHIFILSAILSFIALFMHWILSRIGKSIQGSALACFFLWVMFFTIYPIFQSLNFINNEYFSLFIKALLVISVLFLMIVFIFIGRSLKNKKIFHILSLFITVVFLYNFSFATVKYISKLLFYDSHENYKTSFIISSDNPSPNIYWLHMDGMLGFGAMKYFFDDSQTEFKIDLIERGFLINYDAEFEGNRSTEFAIPALMCPFYYDKVVLPLLQSIDHYDYFEIQQKLKVLNYSNYTARFNNELISAFNKKGYKTVIIGTPGFYWPLTTDIFFTRQGKINYTASNSRNTEVFFQIDQLRMLLQTKIPGIIIAPIRKFTTRTYNKMLNIEPFKMPSNNIMGIEKMLIYANSTWYINVLSEVFENKQPQLTIFEDHKAHFPFVLDKDGSRITRNESERLNIYNYPPQHYFTKNFLVDLIDFILANDSEAIIVVQGDHGIHDKRLVPRQILSSGGTIDDVRLITNSVMSAVRIPEKWGGLDTPLLPLNITRELVNRYVGLNYELLEKHP